MGVVYMHIYILQQKRVQNSASEELCLTPMGTREHPGGGTGEDPSGNPKSEIRNPKEARRPKSEGRRAGRTPDGSPGARRGGWPAAEVFPFFSLHSAPFGSIGLHAARGGTLGWSREPCDTPGRRRPDQADERYAAWPQRKECRHPCRPSPWFGGPKATGGAALRSRRPVVESQSGVHARENSTGRAGEKSNGGNFRKGGKRKAF